MKHKNYVRILLVTLTGLLLVGMNFPGLAQSSQPDVTQPAGAANGDFDVVAQIGAVPSTVAVSGDYAYVGVGPRLAVLDISDPADPTTVGQTDILPGGVGAVAIQGDYAYTGINGAGLYVIDVSTPAAPVVYSTYEFTNSSIRGIDLAGDYAYLAARDVGLHILDISDPSSPDGAAVYGPPNGNVSTVVVDGTDAYLVNSVSGGTDNLGILDVSDPTQPEEVDSVDISDYTQGLFVAGRYAYLTDWQGDGLHIVDLLAAGGPTKVGYYAAVGYNAHDVVVVGTLAYVASNSGMYVLNVSDPGAIYQVSRYRPSDRYYFSEIVIDGDYAYLIDDEGGYKLWIVNVETPAAPYFEGEYNSLGNTMGLDIEGSYIYIAGDSQGLSIVDISTPAAPAVVGSYKWTKGLVLDVDAAVDGPTTYAYLAADDDGMLVMDVSDPALPEEVSSYPTSGNVMDVEIIGNDAYFVDGISLQIIDISKPLTPTQKGYYATPGWANGVTVDDALGRAYIADGGSGLLVLDISNPGAIGSLGSYDTTGYAKDIFVDEARAYVADNNRGLRVLDISTLPNPTETGFYDPPGYAYDVLMVEHTAPFSDTAYLAHGNAGIRVLDVYSSTNPVEIGAYDTAGWASKLLIDGYIYVADGSGGLLILDYQPMVPANPSLSINYSSGEQGSYFTLTGEGFTNGALANLPGGNSPAVAPTSIFANGVLLGTATPNAGGYFSVQIYTPLAELGGYKITTDVVCPPVTFRLIDGDPLRAQEASGEILEVPAGIAMNEAVYLPMILK